MTLFKQLLHNWEKGYFSVVKDKEGQYRLFTLWVGGEFLVSYNSENSEDTKSFRGLNFWTRHEIEGNDKSYGWEIIETWHISEFVGNGFKKGDKVKVKALEGSKEIIDVNKGRYKVGIGSGATLCEAKELSPLLNEETEQTEEELTDIVIDGLDKTKKLLLKYKESLKTN